MLKMSFPKLDRKWKAGPALLAALMMTAMMSACVTSGDGDPDPEPESAYGWAWESGSITAGQAGIYGTKGTASASNAPGSRELAQAWFSSGSAWLFGGSGYDAARSGGYLNDLWKYSPTSREWTWVSGSNSVSQRGSYGALGIPAPANVPGARSGPASWVDANGALWLFGGRGHDEGGNIGYLNDLWKFDAAALQWTWISGSNADDRPGLYGTKGTPSTANIPGGRLGAVAWLDANGNVWLFGGYGLDAVGSAGDLNDLWKFDPVNGEWTWVSGEDLKNVPGVYGTKGTPAPGNFPGARDTSAGWRDASGKFWLFGGGGFGSTASLGQLNDLWKFDPATLQWTWISGSDSVNQSGVYGTQGTPSASNIPGGNCGANAWIDSTGRLYLFGGRGYDATGLLGALHDLWRFDPTAVTWTWVAGDKTANRQGVYGTKGKRLLTNIPGGREYAATFQDASGNLWSFGGTGYDSGGVTNYLNDLWKYTRQN